MSRCAECENTWGESTACHGCHGWAHFVPLPPNDGSRRCGTCKHFNYGSGSDICRVCNPPAYVHWKFVRDLLHDDELLSCDDTTLLCREELERLVVLLRVEAAREPIHSDGESASCLEAKEERR